MDEKTVKCCNFPISGMRHNLHRSWTKTKRLKMKVFDVDSLRRGAGVNVQDDNGYTPLHHACLNGHKEIVRLLLAVDASPCIADKRGATPLHLAAWKGESEIVAKLLAHKNPPVNVDQVTADHETALLSAAHFGYTDVVKQLIDKGADVTIRNIRDESALDLAAQYGRLETVQYLLDVMPTLVEPYKMSRCRAKTFSTTPLHRASKNGRKEVVQVLLAAGMDPNIRTYNLSTPLHEAACFGKASVVRILLANGADLNAVDRHGKSVHNLLSVYSEEATRKVRRVIREYENRSRLTTYESEEELPPFPVQGYSPNIVKAPETQETTNKIKSFVHPTSSSQLTKNQSQSFVKKLASKCLGLKAKFNSAPNISNNSANETEVDVKSKHSDGKSSTNTLLIGNSKFFNKILSKKEESGEVVCTNEFDTISLDRLSTLNRDSVINRSNRSCPGFKTSLPNISENNELSDSHDSIAESVVITEIDCDNNMNNKNEIHEAINHNASKLISNSLEKKRISRISTDSSNTPLIMNECYESYEFSHKETSPVGCPINDTFIPKPPPRPNINSRNVTNDNTIYENVVVCGQIARPTPAARVHLPSKIPLDEVEKKVLYENVSLLKEKTPEPPKRTVLTLSNEIEGENDRSVSRSSTMSSDSMIDESNLEDILLSQKSKSFRHGIHPGILRKRSKSNVSNTCSNSSSSSNITEASAIENVDCSSEITDKNIYLSMTGTLPVKKKATPEKKVLFRHKTFTNMEVDRNSIKLKDIPKWNNDFLKETLAHYHIRGTGHCIYKGPTVSEFIDVFNRDTLYKDVPPFTKMPNNKRDSYFETAICFCKPRPPKHHNSAEDLLEINANDAEESVNIDMDVFRKKREMDSTSFRCFCDSETCTFHSEKREASNFVVKFSVIKKSISTPDITLNIYSSLTKRNSGLIKNKSVPSNLEEPYAVVSLEDIVARRKNGGDNKVTDLDSPEYVCMMPSTLHSTSSSSSNQPYSLKDISEVISLNSTSTTASLSRACDSIQIPLGKSSSEHSGHWSLQSCDSNVTIQSDASFVTCFEESEDSDDTLHSDEEVSDTDTIKSNISTGKRPWVHSDSFRFGSRDAKFIVESIAEESLKDSGSSKFESGISLDDSDSCSSEEGDDDSGVPGVEAGVLVASLERGSGVDGGVRSGSGRRRWEEAEGTSEGDALSVSSAASSCAPLHLAHHHEYSKVSPTPPKKPPRRNLSVSPTHANSPSSGYSYELRPHARSQDDLDDIQGAKHYLKHGRSVDQYVDGKLSYSEYEDNHNSPRIAPVPNPRPSLSLKNRSQPVAITAMYENVVIKEQNPRRKLRRNFAPQYENYEPRMNDNRVRKYSNQEKSSLESLLDDQSMNSPSDCERYYEGPRVEIPLSPSHYEQPPTPDHPPPSAKQAENSIHERIRPLSQLIMEVVEEIRIRKKSQGDVTSS